MMAESIFDELKFFIIHSPYLMKKLLNDKWIFIAVWKTKKLSLLLNINNNVKED